MDQRSKWMIASKIKTKKLLTAVNSIAALAILFFGYDQGLMGGVNISNDYIETMGLGYIDSSGTPVVTETLLEGGIVSIFYMGTLLGCLMAGIIGDRYGRITTIGVGCVWALIGASLQCTAQNAGWMLAARLINGIGTGALTGIVPVWASEMVEHTSRGKFIAMEFTLNIFGVVVAYWLGFGVSFIDQGRSQFRWRFPIAFQIVPLLVLIATFWAAPESPRWLCKVGRDEEALFVLRRLRGDQGVDIGKAEAEMMDIQSVVELEKEKTKETSYFSMFFGVGSGKLHTGRRVQLVIWLQIMQCWSGIAGITMFGPRIFSIAGYASSKSQWLSGLNNVFYMFATIICVYTLDKIGRRWTLFWGSASQGISMFLAGGLCTGALSASRKGDIGAAAEWGAGAASMVFIYTFVFGATWLTVPWIYPAEIFPLHIRAKGNAWGVVGWSIGNGTLTLALPYIVAAINENMLHIFGACNILCIPVVWALYPESNQRTLEEMDFLFAADTPWTWDAEANFKVLKEANPNLNNTHNRQHSLADQNKEGNKDDHTEYLA